MPEEPKDTPHSVENAPDRQIALDTYIALVNRCAEGRVNQAISNGSPFHARILISKLFEIAKKKVEIVSGSMTDVTSKGVDIYGFPSVIAQAKRFLRDPSANLTIIVQSGTINNGSQNRFLSQVIGDADRNGTVELLISEPDELGATIPHFMVSDGAAYRFEPSSNAQPNQPNIVAVGNFGDVPFARELGSYFGTLVEFLSANKKIKSRTVFTPATKEFAIPA